MIDGLVPGFDLVPVPFLNARKHPIIAIIIHINNIPKYSSGTIKSAIKKITATSATIITIIAAIGINATLTGNHAKFILYVI